MAKKEKIKTYKGVELWNKAKKIIPGGTQLLSKRSERFLPENWPSYYKNAKGIEIEDLDGNKFIDMSIMGIGCCILGYADDDVNAAVKKVIESGSMSTLNSPEEVELAEKLIEIHPWAQQVRYARTGGESMAIAARIGRAYSKKDKIAFCGYHGWHDWYLSSNLADYNNLDGHLLPGLEPLGVPKALIKTAIPFHYNNIEELNEIVSKHDIGTIIVEPIRHQEPKNNFLQNVKEIAKKIGAVLIFDEISCGWRDNLGGTHLTFGVEPDIAVFGKAISNGFPMSAIIGTKDVMDCFQKSFISSTYWTERIGPAAAIATINKMEKNEVWKHISKIGSIIGKKWEELAEKHGLDISIIGPNSLITFSFNYKNQLELNTLFTQEMLKRGYLASNTIYVSYSHKEEHLNNYFNNVDEVFSIIKQGIEKSNIKSLLDGPVANPEFKRVT